MWYKAYSSTDEWKGLDSTSTGITIFNTIPIGFPSCEPPKPLNETFLKNLPQIIEEINVDGKTNVEWWIYLMKNKIPQEIHFSNTRDLHNWTITKHPTEQLADQSNEFISKLRKKVKKLASENCEIEVYQFNQKLVPLTIGMLVISKCNDDNGFKIGSYLGKTFIQETKSPSVRVNWLRTFGAGIDATYKHFDNNEPSKCAQQDIWLYGENFLTKQFTLKKNVYNYISKHLQ